MHANWPVPQPTKAPPPHTHTHIHARARTCTRPHPSPQEPPPEGVVEVVRYRAGFDQARTEDDLWQLFRWDPHAPAAARSRAAQPRRASSCSRGRGRPAAASGRLRRRGSGGGLAPHARPALAAPHPQTAAAPPPPRIHRTPPNQPYSNFNPRAGTTWTRTWRPSAEGTGASVSLRISCCGSTRRCRGTSRRAAAERRAVPRCVFFVSVCEHARACIWFCVFVCVCVCVCVRGSRWAFEGRNWLAMLRRGCGSGVLRRFDRQFTGAWHHCHSRCEAGD